MYIIFTVIVFLATLIGSIFGIGGGIIIKPALEAASNLPLSYVNSISGLTVLCMSVVSFTQYLKNGVKLDSRIIWLSLGAVGGGFLGKALFEFMNLFMKEEFAKTLQYFLLICLMIAALFKDKFKTYNIGGNTASLLSGVCMGILSSFLGIGGGPVNLLVIYVVLGVDTKIAAIYSIFAILCSQLSMVTLTAVTGGYAGSDWYLLLLMVTSAIIGGLIGPIVHKKWDLVRIEKYYKYLLMALIVLNLYNIAQTLT